ncbi:MAG: InlB B-repeat-containing protein [Clostridiales bacterium]|nr:InlB B-repeat-containing protein [Clostridiales bacterium]
MKAKRILALLVSLVMVIQLMPAALADAFYDAARDKAPAVKTETPADEQTDDPVGEPVKPANRGAVRGRNDVATVEYADGDGFESYLTLTEAIAAAGTEIDGYPLGTTIKLAKNAAENVVFPAGKDVVLDLNGKTLSNANSSHTVIVRGGLTVVDSVGSGLIKSDNNCAICVQGGTLTFEGGSVEAQEMAVFMIDAGTAVINAGTFTAHDNAVLGSNGSNGRGGNNVTVNGGTFIGTIQTAGYVACGVYAANDDVWNIEGGTFDITNGAGIVARAGHVSVGEGVVINTTGNSVGKVGDSRVVVPCSAIVFDSEANYPGLNDDSVIEVTGGTFTSEVDPVAAIGDNYIEITGGKFSDKPEDKYFADGLTASSETTDGFYTVVGDTRVAKIGDVRYATLADALAAVQDGEEIVLLNDAEMSEVVAITKSITLNGSGKTLKTTATRGIWVAASDVDVTIKNLTVVSTNGAMERAFQVNLNYTGVKLTLDNCTATATMYTVNICNGVENLELIIRNCDLTGWGVINLWGKNGNVTISDSKLTGINDKSYNAEGWNSFGVIIVEGDTTGQTDMHAAAYDIKLTGCTITATETTGNKQCILLYNNPSVSNAMTLEDCTIVLNSDNCTFLLDRGDESTTKIKNTTVQATGELPELPAMLAWLENGSYYVVVDAIAQVGDKYYATFAEAAAAANGETIILLADADAEYTLESGEMKVQLNGYALTVNAPAGSVLKTSEAEGVTTYTSAKAVAKIGDTLYASVAEALADAVSGDTVEVFAGEHELSGTIPENVTVCGAGKDQTKLILTATFNLTKKNSAIKNAYIDGSQLPNSYYAGVINLKADGATLENCIIYGGGGGTWSATVGISGIAAGETVYLKDCEISGGFRSVFLGSPKGNVEIDGCTLTPGAYTISVDGASTTTEITVKNSTLKGWTSYSKVKASTFENVTFVKGNYDYMRPYGDTTFINCTFDSSFKLNVVNGATATLEECYRTNANGESVLVTAANYSDFVSFGNEASDLVAPVAIVDGTIYYGSVKNPDMTEAVNAAHALNDFADSYTFYCDPTPALPEGYAAYQNSDDGLWIVYKLVTGINVAPADLFFIKGDTETKTLTATVVPADAMNTELVWTSSDETVATVDQNGVVTPVGQGVATITVASVAQPEMKAEVTVVVAVAKVTDGENNEIYYATLQDAVNAAHELTGNVTVTLLADVQEVVVIHQKAGLNLTVMGENMPTITGQIHIDGDGRSTGTDTVTITGLKFAYDAATYEGGFVNLPNTKNTGKVYTTGKWNYAHNITVSDCEFAGVYGTTVAFNFGSIGGGIRNITLKNLTADAMHSLAQFNGVDNVTIEGCKLTNAKNGVNMTNVAGTVIIKDCEITSDGYTFRMKGSSSADATLSGNTFNGTEGIVFNTSEAAGTIHITDGYYGGPLSADAANKGSFDITGGYFTVAPALAYCGTDAEGNQLYPMASDNADYPYTVGAPVAVVNDFGYDSVADAKAGRDTEDDVITLLKIADYAFVAGDVLKIYKANDTIEFTYTVPETYVLSISAPDENGVVTYTVRGAVAKIGNTLYASLAEAVAAVPADGTETTIVMIADVRIDVSGYAVTIPANKNVVLDLNGHEVIGQCTTTGTSALIRNLGALTIRDSAGNGKLIGGADPTWTWDGSDDYSGSYASNLIRNEGTLTVDGGTLYNASSGSAAYAIDNYSAGKVTINGGTVDAAKAAAIRMFYCNGGVVTVNGGTIGRYNSDDDCSYMGIQVMSGTNAVVNVTGGMIAGMYALYSNATGDSAVNISGGEFDGYVGFAAGQNNIAISGGKFYEWAGTWGDQTEFISGGEFAVEPDPEYIVRGKCAVQREDDWWIITDAVAEIGTIGYVTFAAAAEAREDYDTVIHLLAKITEPYTLALDETLKVRKDGKSITVKAPEGPYVVKSVTADGVTTYTVVEADIEYTAANGTVSYKLFSGTVISGSGTYKLLKDITATVRIVPGVMATNVTLDLNGHILTSTASDYAILLSRNGSEASPKTFAVIDSSADKGGKLVVNPAADDAIMVSGKYNYVTIGEGVTIEGGCVAVLSENDKLDVYGTIIGGDDFAVATNGSSTKNATITIHDGAVLTSDVTAMYLPGNVGLVVTIEDGTAITGSTGIEIRAGKLDIQGGTITATGAFSEAQNGSGTTVTGAAVAISQHTTNLPIEVTVSGGTLIGEKALYEVDLQDETTDGVTISVTGGFFNGAIESENVEGFITCGFFTDAPAAEYCGNDLYPIESGRDDEYKYTVGDAVAKIGDKYYTTLEAAFAAAADNDTIVLLKDVECGNIEVGKKVTLDLDGKTIQATDPELFSVTANGDLTITGNGTINGVANGAAYDGRALITVDAGKLTIENGTLTATGEGSDGMYGVYVLNGGSAVFGKEGETDGPTITAHFAAIGENHMTAPGSITVYGGTYTANAEPNGAWWYYFCAAIYAPGSGAIDIYGGTFNGYYGISDRYADVEQELNIYGGTFNASSGTQIFVDEVNGSDGTANRTIWAADNALTVPEEYIWGEAEDEGYILSKAVTVTFVTEDGIEAPEAQRIPVNTKAEKPADPEKENYNFIGWFAEGSDTAFDFDTPVTEDITLTARFEGVPVTIIYTDAVTGRVLQIIVVHYNDPKEDYAFTAFNKIQARTGFHYDENDMWTIEVADYATEDTVYVLKWIPNTVTVTFYTDGGNAIDPVEVEYGTPVAEPATPVKDGFIFAGWTLNGAAYDFSANVTENITLVATWAEAVAKIGDTMYATLTDAIAAVNAGETIELLKDVTESVVEIGGGKSFTLDLGAHTLTVDYIDQYDAFVTIKNGTVAGTIYANGLANGETGKLTIASDAAIEADYAIILYQAADKTGNGYTIDINGTVNGIVWVMGNILSGDSVINVNDGAVINGDDVGIAINGYATVNVYEGATVTGTATGIEVRAGVLNVEGGTITGNGASTSVTANGSGTTTVGAGIAVAQHTTGLDITVNISGGTINGTTALNVANPQGGNDGTIAIEVTGGIFNGPVNVDENETRAANFISGGYYLETVDPDYVAEGKLCTTTLTENIDGTEYYYIVNAVTITLDPCNDGASESVTVMIPAGESLSEDDLFTPEYDRWHRFIGWFLNAGIGVATGTGTEVTDETVFDEDTTIYANWYMPGDVNGDGKVNNKDVNRLLQYIAGDDVEVVLKACDTNGDGKINNKDVSRLLQYLAGDNVEIF